MHLFELSRHLSSNENSRDFLMQRGVFHESRRCPNRHCRRQMVLERNDVQAGFIWRCPSADRRTRSFLADSYFQNSNLSMSEILGLIYGWTYDCTNQQISEFFDISENTVTDWANLFREMCSWKLLQQPIVLGGPNQVVQIDESVVARRKYNVGRLLQTQWVFGAYDVNAKLGYIQLVPDRSAATLLPIIANVIAPGSIVHSDSWAAYNRVAQLGYQHGMVNHTLNFVSPAGVHTQNVERYWRTVKQKLKRFYGVQRQMLPGYLDEVMWRERFGRSHEDAFDSFLTHLSEWRANH